MLMKICPRCKSKYQYRKPCPNGCLEKNRKERNKVYDKTQRKNSSFYKSRQWAKLTRACKAKFNGIDIYQLYKYKKLVPGVLSHHIEDLDNSPCKKLDLDNLIYLSDESHREIHKIYNQSRSCKNALQKFLKFLVSRYLEEVEN